MLFIEIDMKPAASGGGRLVCGDIDQPSAYAMPSNSCAHYGVNDERMNGTVPGHVDEADQLAALSSRHPAEAMRLHLPEPVDTKNWMGEGFGVQHVQFLVRELVAPLKTVSIHEDRVIASPSRDQYIGCDHDQPVFQASVARSAGRGRRQLLLRELARSCACCMPKARRRIDGCLGRSLLEPPTPLTPRGPELTAPLPLDACARFGPDPPPGNARPRYPDATGGFYQPLVLFTAGQSYVHL